MKAFAAIFTFFLCARHAAGQETGANSSISITYAYSMQKYANPDFTARINNTFDAVNGVAYNYGNAVGFNISSPQNYTVRISSVNAGGISSPGRDIRNYIFYSMADNNTGGRSYGSGIQPLGMEEKTLLTGCPATRMLQERPENHYKSFSLIFWAKVGYSVPPGNYSTQVILTATTE